MGWFTKFKENIIKDTFKFQIHRLVHIDYEFSLKFIDEGV